MEKYDIYFKKSAKKELGEIVQPDLGRVIKKIALLEYHPRMMGSEKLSGDDKYRIRQGNYRVVYEIHDSAREIWIVKISHRKDVCREI